MTPPKTSWLRNRPRLKPSFTAFQQYDAMDCGPTCVRMVAGHYGKRFTQREMRERACIDRGGVSLLGIAYAAEAVGFRTLSVRTTLQALESEAPLPCIVHWRQNHFVVVHRVTRDHVYVADPAEGLLSYTHEEFTRGWLQDGGQTSERGVALLLEPTPGFFEQDDTQRADRASLRSLLGYVRGYRGFFAQVALGMVVASLLQLVFPFLTQALVDHGIGNQDLGFVNVVLLAQLALLASRTSVEFIRNRILFHVGTRIYVSIISDFLAKLLRLPVPFFDTRHVGDILQRVQDHTRIQQFLTATLLQTLFSVMTLTVFSVVLAVYSWAIFGVFAVGSLVYVAYSLFFLKRRKALDYQKFAEQARTQSTLVELVGGIGEIKLANAEQQKRWAWERIQARLFRVSLKSLSLDQFQDGGSIAINEMKNILITFLGAKLVIDGQLTLGMLLAVQYIIGQLNAPLGQLVSIVHNAQDARIAAERLGELHDYPDEEVPGEKLTTLPEDGSLSLRGVSFGYGGALGEEVLKDVDMDIPEGKVTAIVGASGSGKTTLLKLLLKFYVPSKGEIGVGGSPLASISARTWRSECGAVLQDGQLFSDTIAGNVAVGDDVVDQRRLLHAVTVANIRGYVEALPLGYNTRVGRDGLGMSQGQQQRLLIARAVYKQPRYLLFDEATSSLDANNEKAIMGALQDEFRGRTVVIVAHRLSTVRNADQIVVMDRGRVVEKGTHDELAALRGHYYTLVKNQLELGS
ncbi:MAG TPA: peptidase domain-containing ABC transporter [Longimicrobium sp.]|nr:peptidase domain-containing ABC transporter [Longimicrobium sp.]